VIDGIPLGAIGDLSGWIVGAALVVSGRLIPWWWHNRWVAEYKATIAKLEAAVDKKDQQIAELLGREVRR
jgi:hypothetical protein